MLRTGLQLVRVELVPPPPGPHLGHSCLGPPHPDPLPRLGHPPRAHHRHPRGPPHLPQQLGRQAHYCRGHPPGRAHPLSCALGPHKLPHPYPQLGRSHQCQLGLPLLEFTLSQELVVLVVNEGLAGI